MPMKLLTKLIIALFICNFNVLGSECNCLKNMILLQQKVEENLASYQHQVIEFNRIDKYRVFKNQINNLAKNTTTNNYCIGLISYYLSFFEDSHLSILYNSNYAPKPNKIYKSKLNKIGKQNSIEGKWHFADGSFGINIFLKKAGIGNYIAVIDYDMSGKWKKGELKIEFVHDGDNDFKCIYWRQNLIPKTFSVISNDSILKIGRNITFYRKKVNAKAPVFDDSNQVIFSVLSKESCYLKISSFDLSLRDKIDSVISHNKIEIVSRENLIIDIRNNGGGGFDAFKPLLPLVLDTSIVEPPFYASVWVSNDNYEYYDRTKYDFVETKQDSINELQYVEFLKKHLGSFTPVENYFDTIQLELNFPRNVAILYNRNSASSAEGFILQSNLSKKVKTFGEHSAGAVSYGDWMPFSLPELNISISISTKKMIFKNDLKIENIGIKPDYNLEHVNENDWLNTVIDIMEK